MAVVAVLLATVVAASIGGEDPPPERDHPHASFSFSVVNSSVVIEHTRGDALNGSKVYVESATRGHLGNMAGTDGVACTAVVSQVEVGSTCSVPDAADERLFVVWAGPDNRTLSLAERAPDGAPGTDTASVSTSTRTPERTESPPPGGTETPTDTDTSAGTDETTTSTPTETGPATPTETSTGSPIPTTSTTPTSTPTPTASRTPTVTQEPAEGTNSTDSQDS